MRRTPTGSHVRRMEIAGQRRLRPCVKDLAIGGRGCHDRHATVALTLLRSAPDGEIATAAADGKVRFLTLRARKPARCKPAWPQVSLKRLTDGRWIAAAGTGGVRIAIIDRRGAQRRADARWFGSPVWSRGVLAR